VEKESHLIHQSASQGEKEATEESTKSVTHASMKRATGLSSKLALLEKQANTGGTS